MSYADIPGYSGFLWLYEEWVPTAPRNAIAIEVGVALGHSIARLAELCIQHGRRDIRVYAVDPWGGYARNGEQQAVLGGDNDADRKPYGDFRLFLNAMTEHAPDELEHIRIIRADSKQAADMFETADLVLIDAAHDYESVTVDIRAWAVAAWAVGGILAGDDHEPHYPGVQEACERAFGAGNYEVKGSTWVKRF